VICHLGVVVDGYPMVLPTVCGLAGGTVYPNGKEPAKTTPAGAYCRFRPPARGYPPGVLALAQLP
jgi:hypothetical protein